METKAKSHREKGSFFDKLFANEGFKSFLAALICILIGLLIGYIALLIINPDEANKEILKIIGNFFSAEKSETRIKRLADTLIKTAPLLLCSLSILFAYKVGLFNIGVAGQYVAGAGIALYFALGLNLPWYLCLLAGVLAGALLGGISGILKAFLNVNEVISGIMLNWISLYTVNPVLRAYRIQGKDTFPLEQHNRSAILPRLGLDKLFNGYKYVTIAIPIAILVAVLIWVILKKTKFGYELKATGYNRHAAKYCGMREKRNLLLTLVIAGALAGLAAGLFFLTDREAWDTNQSAVPLMGFNGIAAAFLGGLHPIGAIFSSYFIQHITDGGNVMLDKNIYPPQVADLISSLIIYLCGFTLFFKLHMKGRAGERKKRGRKTAAPIEAAEAFETAKNAEGGEE